MELERCLSAEMEKVRIVMDEVAPAAAHPSGWVSRVIAFFFWAVL